MERRSFLAYGTLGLLVGMLVGLSGGDIAKALLAGIFAFSGGSAIALTSKVDAAARQWAASATMAISLFAIIGLIGGILATQHRVFGGEREAATLDGLITEVVAEELERRKAAGRSIEISELVALLGAQREMDVNPFYIAETTQDGSFDVAISLVLQQHATGVLTADQALTEIRALSTSRAGRR